MIRSLFAVAALTAAMTVSQPASAEKPIWGVQIERLEYRIGDETDVASWDFDAIYGTDELKLVFRSEAEYAVKSREVETLENQIRLQTPISDFFDAVVGLRADTPKGPNRYSAVVGLHGLAQQWFEIDADLFLSDKPSVRLEVDYEGLITNRVTLTPSFEIDLPLVDDHEVGIGAFGPKIEIGVRLSYDLVDRLISPYIGIHYERKFGESANLARQDGEDAGALFAVVGARILF